MSWTLLTDAEGEPLPFDGPTELVPGSELRQAGSHTALLRSGARTLFVKKATQEMVAKKEWNDRRRVLLYIRNELRFYAEFAEDLRSRGVDVPLSHHLAGVNLDGLEAHDDEPEVDFCGGVMLLQALEPSRYFQTSPLTPAQTKRVLDAAARLHGAAWEDAPLLERAAARLVRHGGSGALTARNPKELQELPASWDRFAAAFASEAPPGFFARPEIARLGVRLHAAAVYISAQLSPAPADPFATLVHGDLKAMNVFLPRGDTEDDRAVLIDFASTGVGNAMTDVVLHLVHALTPADLDGGGEEALVDYYLEALATRRGGGAAPYPREAALRHYRLAVCDYGRFVMGRFWRDATPASFAANAAKPNVVLANRNLASALRFVERISECLAAVEVEMAASN